MTPEDHVETFLRGASDRAPFSRLGVAGSGGGDSLALLHLLNDWAREEGVILSAVTVDHGLRAEAAAEAQFVAQVCADLGLSHEVLTWTGWDQRGNLQDAARAARYGLITDWAQHSGVEAVALGHTQDDQAETFLMRLTRGSGVDGLAAMRTDWRAEGLRWLRPTLDIPRADLRAYLDGRGQGWIDDPSNDDMRYDRVKARAAMDALTELGLSAKRLSETAQRMTNARHALEIFTQDAARRVCRIHAGEVHFDLGPTSELPYEIQTRLFAHALMWVASSPYRPRLDALYETIAMAAGGDRRTLHGCLVEGDLDTIRISREYNAVRDKRTAPDTPWDSRWTLSGPDPDVSIRALGNAVSDCPDWRETGVARRALMASPSVWKDAELIAAPLAGLANGWSAEIIHPEDHFFSSLLSH